MNMISTSYRLLRSRRDFALLMAVQFSAQAGDGLVQASIAKLIVFGGQEGFDLEAARSPDELLRIALFLFIPYTILSPFLGVVIDLWDRVRLLAVTAAARAVLLLAVAVIGTDRVADAVLFGVFLVMLAVTRIVLATKAASIRSTVEDDELVDANAVSQLGGAVMGLGGAGAAIVAAGFLPVEIPVAVGAVVYGLGAIAAMGIRKLADERERISLGAALAQAGRRIVEGIREVVGNAQAAASISTYFWLRFLWSFAFVAIGFIARDLLAGDDTLVVVVTGGAGAVGAGLGFVTAQTMRTRFKTLGALVLGAALLMGSAVAVLGALEMNLTIAALAFFLGFGFFLAKISLDTLVQEALGDDFRGRAFALYDIAYNVGWVAAAALLKVFWDAEENSLLIATVGVVYLIGTIVLGRWFQRADLLKVAPAETA